MAWRCVAMCMPRCLHRFLFLCNGSLLRPEPSQSRAIAPSYRATSVPIRHPENPICQRSNALHHPHMSGQVFSPLRTRRLPAAAAAVDVSLLLGSAVGSEAIYDRRTQHRGGDASSAFAVQEWLAAASAAATGTRNTSPARWWRTRRCCAPRRRRWA
ncbi:hypothetical protein H4582DRAFT_2027185, partial [Lactarius indigo]